ncbi:MAG: helix-turn-helix domain-containing protein [Pseudomonadota bacterium]|nr:helix-turn-helix domain-containing protein [Pseudomonadota bacterium]
MDALINAAARALATGDPLGALNRISLREDAPALALRGIAMAQLGDFGRARSLLQRARQRFSRKATLARARCQVAETEVALAARDLGWPADRLAQTAATLQQHGDQANAAQAHYLEARRQLLIGQIDAAETLLDTLDPGTFSPAIDTIHHLLKAGIALRRLQTAPARNALTLAQQSARQAAIPALDHEVAHAIEILEAPAARRVSGDREHLMRLQDVEALLASDALIVDGCRYLVRHHQQIVSLTSRPVLFTLVRALAEAWPADVSRHTLIQRAFRLRHTEESHRSRLRVEMGRLRTLLRPLADIAATADGFVLSPRQQRIPVVMAPPVDEKHATVLALLVDGAAWSSSSLALALGTSQRTVQRALDELAQAGKVQGFGRGRARRWTTPSVPGFTTTLLLPAPLPVN